MKKVLCHQILYDKECEFGGHSFGFWLHQSVVKEYIVIFLYGKNFQHFIANIQILIILKSKARDNIVFFSLLHFFFEGLIGAKLFL